MPACLQESGDGFPLGYLRARVQGRRARLADALARLASAPADVAVESAVSPETAAAWLCRQLPRSLRRRLQPALLPFEYRRLVLALRWLLAGQRPRLAELLAGSCLSRRLLAPLLDGEPLPAVLARLDRLLAPPGAHLAGIAVAWEQAGVAGVERLLLAAPLTAGCDAADPALRAACRYQVDAVNLLALYKHLRWQERAPVELLAGGDLGRKRLDALLRQGEPALLFAAARQRSGLAETPVDGVTLELQLWRGYSRLLTRLARDPDGSGLLLQYLWLCTLLTRNREVVRLNRDLPAALLQEELLPWPA